MNRRQLNSLVAEGEGRRLEFKMRTPQPRRLAKEVIAFANSGSGKILLGVDDAGSILGVKDSYEEEYAIRVALDTWCIPPVRWNLRRIQISRKREVLVISVPSRRNGPHYLRRSPGDLRGAAYVRFEDESIEASADAVLLMEEEASDREVRFEFGELEMELMRMLEQSGRVTSGEYAQHVHISIDRARIILVTLVRARILFLNTARRGDYFTQQTENLR